MQEPRRARGHPHPHGSIGFRGHFLWILAPSLPRRYLTTPYFYATMYNGILKISGQEKKMKMVAIMIALAAMILVGCNNANPRNINAARAVFDKLQQDDKVVLQPGEWELRAPGVNGPACTAYTVWMDTEEFPGFVERHYRLNLQEAGLAVSFQTLRQRRALALGRAIAGGGVKQGCPEVANGHDLLAEAVRALTITGQRQELQKLFVVTGEKASKPCVGYAYATGYTVTAAGLSQGAYASSATGGETMGTAIAPPQKSQGSERGHR